ncbi:MAG: DUF3795 domain-containing protein [Deltaproteobacteria bacterium]|nr:DUF3795 domain-containing protein [Deltaproteobacteria bacterium]
MEGTGACGINCYTCKLFTEGRCSSCGSGLSEQATRKLASQLRIMGGVCPILNCAVERKIEYCLRDCESFPCPHFKFGPYPFSEGFLQMQIRRRGGPASENPPKSQIH